MGKEHKQTPNMEEIILVDSVEVKPACITMRPRKYVVEPLILLYLLAGCPLISVIEQWTLVKIGEDMGIDVNPNHGNKTNSTEENLVQSATAIFTRNLKIAEFFPQIIAPLIIGAIGDRYGRRIMLILPCLSSLIMVSTYLSVMFFNLSIWWVYMNVLNYFLGSYPVMMMGCYAYIADTVPPAQRAFRMTVVDIVGPVSGAVINIGVGYLVSKTDFWVPLVGVFFGKIIVLLYALFCVPESLSNKPSEKRVSGKNMLSGIKLFLFDNGKGRRWRLLTLLSAICITDLIDSSGISSEFFMKSPRDFNSFQIGLYDGIGSIIETFAVLMFFIIPYSILPLKYRVIIGRISGASQDICIAFAGSILVLIIAPLLGCLNFLAVPTIRTLMTYQVMQTEQGAMLSVIATLSNLALFINTLSTFNIYKATLEDWDGCVYFISSMVQLTSACLIITYTIMTRHDPVPQLETADTETIEDKMESEESEEGKRHSYKQI